MRYKDGLLISGSLENEAMGVFEMDYRQYRKELEILDNMHQACSLLFVAHNKIQVEADSHLENLTLRQLMLLIAIAHLKPKDATIVGIAAVLGTSKQNVNRLVSHMVKAGYLSSRPSQTDQRSVNISKLTDHEHTGQKHFEKQAEIDIGKESRDMERFLEQVREEYF
jgi:DNA-binding MarR family transcriptional regulator